MRSVETSAGRLRLSSGLAATLTVLILAGLIYWKAQANYRSHDALNSNFFSFWLSGRMVWTGENPYDPAQFQAGFDTYGATYRPSRTLQYPLPLMYFMAPIGALPVQTGYFVWELVSQAILVLVIYLLLPPQPRARFLLAPLTAFMLFFGPVYLSLQIGSVGPLSLLGLGLGLWCLRKGWAVPAGLALSLTLLKPSQALPLLALAGLWFLLRGLRRVILGLALGAAALLAAWLARDPLGLVKFRASSDFLLGHSLGMQSNVYGFAYLACGRNVPCMWTLGSALLAAVLALSAYVLWRNRSRWTDWEAMNVVIPVGFVCTLYLYSYDQLPYVIPVVWITTRLLGTRRPYLAAFAFLAVLDLASFAALTAQDFTGQDLLSILNTVLVLGATAWLLKRAHGDAAVASGA